jgi:hypothetical protein
MACALAVGDGQHLGDAGDLRGFGGDGGRIGGQHQHVDGAAIAAAALTVLAVAALSLPSWCSAMTRTLLITATPSA